MNKRALMRGVLLMVVAPLLIFAGCLRARPRPPVAPCAYWIEQESGPPEYSVYHKWYGAKDLRKFEDGHIEVTNCYDGTHLVVSGTFAYGELSAK